MSILKHFIFFFIAFDFCQFCVVNRFSSPPQRPMTSDFKVFSIPDFIHYIYFPSLILEKEPVFPFLMFSAKQGNYWYHFYNVFWYDAILDWGLNPGPPALDTSTLPLGYLGGGPRLGFEPGTSPTRYQHSTTRLLRRQLNLMVFWN